MFGRTQTPPAKCDIRTMALAVFGSLVILNELVKIVIGIFKAFLRPSKDLKKLGKWAVVTGATDGIGKAYAKALAKKGLNVVLISRTESKLQDVAKEITGVETKYIVCDYSNFDEATRSRVASDLKDLDIGVLVNNVGMSYRYPKFFHELTLEEVEALLEMNVNSTTFMTQMVIGGMVERKRGAIVNISSGSAMYALPLLAEYSAAKSYIEKMTLALHAEYKHVSVQCQIPFYVATKLAKMRKSFSVPTPEQYVAAAMRYVGHDDPVVSPYWVHGVMKWAMDHVPSSAVTAMIMSMHLGIRKKGIKKDAAKKSE